MNPLFEVLKQLREVDDQLSIHPDFLKGNSVVHYCAHKTRASIEVATMAIHKELCDLEVRSLEDWSALNRDAPVLWPDYSDTPYSKGDLIDLCKGDESLSLNLFLLCESGVRPETVIDEDSHSDEGDQVFASCHTDKSSDKPRP